MFAKIHGMHHIGITVPNIEEAIAFFRTVFGAIKVFRTGPIEVDPAFLSNRLGASAESKIRDLVFLKCGEGPSIELFEYSGDEGSRPKRSSEVGATHLCFEVDDVNVCADRLRTAGVELLDGPTLLEFGPLSGFNWIYLRSPWGLLLEVASFDGLGYEANSEHRLWRAKAG